MLLPKDLALLKTLEKDFVLLPVGADHKDAIVKKKKAPVDKKGYPLSGWNKPEQKGFTVDQLWNYPTAIAVGIRCDNIFSIDIDGETASKGAKTFGFLSEPTWTVRRTGCEGYYKLIYCPTPQQLACIPPNARNKKELSFKIYTLEEPDRREAIEFFGNTLGRQVIVAGSHYSSGGRYYWKDNESPKFIRPPSVREWNKVIKLTKQYVSEKVPTPGLVTKNKTGWIRLSECPICGRIERPVCTMTEDQNTISCFHGITYRPPLDLKKGEVLFDTWAYSRTEDKSFGKFSYFARHRPNPVELLNRRLKNLV